MAYKIWAVIPPQGGSPSPLPAEAFFIDEAAAADKTAAQEWLDSNEYEGYEVDDEVSTITGGGGGIRPTSSGGRPI